MPKIMLFFDGPWIAVHWKTVAEQLQTWPNDKWGR